MWLGRGARVKRPAKGPRTPALRTMPQPIAQPQKEALARWGAAIRCAWSSRVAALLWAALWAVLPLPPPAAFGQSGFEREVLYTRVAGTATLRAATVKYELSPAPTLTIGAVASVGSPSGADGLCMSPRGDVMVAGGAAAANMVHRVNRADGSVVTVSPGVGAPVATQLALDPAGDKVWAVCTVGGSGRIARIPLSPFAQGVASAISGADTVIAQVCFAHGRMYYVATGTGQGSGWLGTIDPITFTTTRLLGGLDRPIGVTFDPYTGHVVAFGRTSITQIDARPGMAAMVVSAAELGDVVPSIEVRSGTVDGRGRALALSATGHIVVVDYVATREVGHAGNPRVAAVLESAEVLGSIVPLTGAGALREGGCLWDGGGFDERDGLPSHNSWMTGDMRTADDFYLCPGVHRIDSIEATMFSDSLFLTALVEVYADCDGSPGALLESFSANVSDTGSVFQNLRVLNVHAHTPGFWLRGGRSYWVSAVGIGSLDGSDNWYWGTSGGAAIGAPPGTPNTIRGRPAMFRAPAQGVADWTPSDAAGCGCTDFAFRIRGETCKVLHDNGPPQAAGDPVVTGAPSIISTTGSDARGADNFRVPPCAELGGERVCFIEATIYTNCMPVRGIVEILANDCAIPFGPTLFSGPFSKVIDLGYNLVLGGSSLRAYTVQVHDPGWFLPQGRNYWLSIAVQGSGGFSQRAYFGANASGCAAEACAIRISQSAVRGAAVSSPGWTLIENYLQVPRDLSFVIAVAERQVGGEGGSGGNANPTCLADAELDGDVDVADIFAFLSRWFQGCP